MYLSLGGEVARKQFQDKNLHNWDLKARELIQLATDCNQKTTNRTLDWQKFLSGPKTVTTGVVTLVLAFSKRLGCAMRLQKNHKYPGIG